MSFEEVKETIVTAELEDEPKPEPPPAVVYDRHAVQNVPMQIPRGDKTFNVSVDLAPIPDEDYFKLLEEIPENAKRVKTISVELFAPFANLGRRLAVARHGFKERPDWREATDDVYFINAVKGVLECVPVMEGAATDELLDDDAEIKVTLKSPFNGKECLTHVYFREESAEEMDEFFAALRGEPQKGVLASAKRISKERRLFALFEKTRLRVENYKNNDIPAWQAVAALESFLLMQFGRVGKPDIV
jgi:hypothetical protein